MKADAHLAKAREIQASIDVLKMDEAEQHVVSIVGMVYGVAQHLISYGMEQKYGKHLDSHVGLPRELRLLNEDETAQKFERLDTLRHGRWYGKQGNGKIVTECIKLLSDIERWAIK